MSTIMQKSLLHTFFAKKGSNFLQIHIQHTCICNIFILIGYQFIVSQTLQYIYKIKFKNSKMPGSIRPFS